VISELRAHCRAQQEQRLALRLGKSPADALVFAKYDGNTHASQLIAAA
jgi:hypothetical protein